MELSREQWTVTILEKKGNVPDAECHQRLCDDEVSDVISLRTVENGIASSSNLTLEDDPPSVGKPTIDYDDDLRQDSIISPETGA